jgi:chaperonin GroES
VIRRPDVRARRTRHGLSGEETAGRRFGYRQVRQRRKSMKVKPLQDRLVVKRIEEEETTKGGIIIPDAAKEKPQEGRVVAVGDGKVLESGQRAPLTVKVGDKILFGKYSGTEIKIDGEEHLILREDDVLAVIED